MPYIVVAVTALTMSMIVGPGCRRKAPLPEPGRSGQADLNEVSALRAKVNRLRMNSIRLLPGSQQPGEPVVGESHLGGDPDLPEGTEWPRWSKGPLAFIAQVRLSDAASLDRGGLLPRSGVLYFFYDANTQTWGFDPSDRGSSRVIYLDESGSALRPTTAPADLPREVRFNRRPLTLQAETTWPDPSSLEIQALDLGTSEQDDYAEMLASADEAPQHRLLGHPQVIQNEMQTECALVTHGLYTGDSTGYRDPRAAELRKGAADWLLLLQIDSDDKAGMMWGDTGRIYFWIRRQDLAARRFDQAWLILQCY